MAEDQSVCGKRRIYYDQYGSETLICSDSEEDLPEKEDGKHDFTEGEDHILWNIMEKYGETVEVINSLCRCIKATYSEVKERFDFLKERPKTSRLSEENHDVLESKRSFILRKSLTAGLDSFDNLFCRRCLVFDCRLHRCSQGVIFPLEKLSCHVEEVKKPCSEWCYLRKQMDSIDERAASDPASPCTEAVISLSSNGRKAVEVSDHGGIVVKQASSSSKGQADPEKSSNGWNLFEKELYLKGLEIFGKNSCLIARNLLPGLRTCLEVSNYIVDDESSVKLKCTILPVSYSEDVAKTLSDVELQPKTRFWHRRGRARKLKYSSKTTGHPLIRKRMADGKQQSCKQYTPCGCQPVCGKQCPCLDNGTCCEKYCGCSRSCKNRFRGCHCAKSHCRSRQCPCYAASRECDPDVCRNCWVSCGDGTLDGTPKREENYQCGNMTLLLKQQQRILLGRSDVAGWGAFLKNPVNRNDYLGEYTGELISHKEADKRGKIYDRANSSFLFDLNDQYVLDAYRKGDKLKFANHSSSPNCYAKVMMVASDHRVGIFAKDHVNACEELFYDYRYEPDCAPNWARKPGSLKRDDSTSSQGRPRKIA